MEMRQKQHLSKQCMSTTQIFEGFKNHIFQIDTNFLLSKGRTHVIMKVMETYLDSSKKESEIYFFKSSLWLNNPPGSCLCAMPSCSSLPQFALNGDSNTKSKCIAKFCSNHGMFMQQIY